MVSVARGCVALVLLALIGCADKDEKWERSRTVYCDELGLARNKADGALKDAMARLEAQPTPADCAAMRQTLEVTAAWLDGFEKSAHILARGRGASEDVAAAGFVLNHPFEPILRANTRSLEQACQDANTVEAKAVIEQAMAELDRRFDEKLTACRKTGWKD